MSLFCTSLHTHTYTEGRWCGETWEVKSTKPKRFSLTVLRRTNAATPWFQTYNAQNYETINFWCLSHPVYGVLLWQPWQTNILSIEYMLFLPTFSLLLNFEKSRIIVHPSNSLKAFGSGRKATTSCWCHKLGLTCLTLCSGVSRHNFLLAYYIFGCPLIFVIFHPFLFEGLLSSSFWIPSLLHLSHAFSLPHKYKNRVG